MTLAYCGVGLLPVHVGCFPLGLHGLHHLHLSFQGFFTLSVSVVLVLPDPPFSLSFLTNTQPPTSRDCNLAF